MRKFSLTAMAVVCAVCAWTPTAIAQDWKNDPLVKRAMAIEKRLDAIEAKLGMTNYSKPFTVTLDATTQPTSPAAVASPATATVNYAASPSFGQSLATALPGHNRRQSRRERRHGTGDVWQTASAPTGYEGTYVASYNPDAPQTYQQAFSGLTCVNGRCSNQAR